MATSELAQRAKTLFVQNRPGEALEVAKSGLSVAPDDPHLLRVARNAALRLKDFELGLACTRRLLEIAPTDAKNRSTLVDLLIRRNELASAAEQADALIRQHPEDPHGWILKARVLLADGRTSEAIATFKEGASVHPSADKLLTAARDIALKQAEHAEAVCFGERLAELVPDNANNRAVLGRLYFKSGEFAKALAEAEALIRLCPRDTEGLVLKVHSLLALHRVDAAVATMEAAVAEQPEEQLLLATARNLALRHGRFDTAAAYARRLAETGQADPKNHLIMVQSHLANADIVAAQASVTAFRATGDRLAEKAAHYVDQYEAISAAAPAVVAAWHASMNNFAHEDRGGRVVAGETFKATMIQYWSQGDVPDDVAFVVSNWEQLLEREQLGTVRLFDRNSAMSWIVQNAPEFRHLFANAYHYAMESDIFRIAFASKQPCIYMDVDGWPLEHSAEILRCALESRRTMLYFRHHYPWIVNGFFVSWPDCPFLNELVSQALSVDLDSHPKDHRTIEHTFGPTRYNKVLVDLVGGRTDAEIAMVDGVRGCSKLKLGEIEIYFSHEAAVASVRPPFKLGYKVTGDYWKALRPARSVARHDWQPSSLQK